MAIRYYCRHCDTNVGEIEQHSVNTNQLGFQQLSSQERMDMIEYLNNGDVNVKTICEDCQEALERNPDFHSLHSFLQ